MLPGMFLRVGGRIPGTATICYEAVPSELFARSDHGIVLSRIDVLACYNRYSVIVYVSREL
jgi:uncharacterized protein (DUF779 family)